MSTATKKSTRRRGIETEEHKVNITTEMRRLAVEFHVNNRIALDAKKVCDTAREALYKQMKEAGVAAFSTETTTPKGPLVLEAKLKTPTRDVVDVQKLAKLVTPEQLFQIVSASKKDVVDFAGTDIAVRCSVAVLGTENVSVAPAK